jgi:hypothetical protein
MRNSYQITVRKPEEGKRSLERPGNSWENIKVIIADTECEVWTRFI